MYALIENGEVKQYPYGADVLRRDNPQTSFPKNPTDELLAEYNMYPVKQTARPEHDTITQNLTEGTPVRQKTRNADGAFKADKPTTPENEAWEWVQVWEVSDASAEEIEQRQQAQEQEKEQLRLNAYREESDPLFFKAQRGEATMDEWLAKITEIKQRYT